MAVNTAMQPAADRHAAAAAAAATEQLMCRKADGAALAMQRPEQWSVDSNQQHVAAPFSLLPCRCRHAVRSCC